MNTLVLKYYKVFSCIQDTFIFVSKLFLKNVLMNDLDIITKYFPLNLLFLSVSHKPAHTCLSNLSETKHLSSGSTDFVESNFFLCT